MKQCTNCKFQLEDNQQFCGSCGGSTFEAVFSQGNQNSGSEPQGQSQTDAYVQMQNQPNQPQQYYQNQQYPQQQQQQYPQYQQQPAPQQGYMPQGQQIIIHNTTQKSSNGIGIAGFVMALIALFLGFIPVLGWILWALGFLLSVIGLFITPRGIAIAGLIISLIGVIILITAAAYIASFFAFF